MTRTKRCRAVGLVVGVLFAAAASAEPSSLQRSRGRVFAVNAATQTVSVFEADGTHAYRLVAAEPASLTRNGRPLALGALEVGAPVVVYWRAPASGETTRRAVKIDVPTVPEDTPRDLVDSLLDLKAMPAQ